MEISKKKANDVRVFALSGRFDAMTAGTVEEKLNETLNSGEGRIVLDLSSVDYISSAGLRVLLAALKRTKNEQAGDVRLAGIQPQVRQVFDLAGFAQLFQIFPTEGRAVESYL